VVAREAEDVPTSFSNGPGLSFHPWYVNCVILMPLVLIFSTATSVDVERLFSRGRLILSHTRSRLSVASTRALLCLGSWSQAGLVRDEDVEAVVKLDEVDARVELNKLAEVTTAATS
jgi:hypothetical protein